MSQPESKPIGNTDDSERGRGLAHDRAVDGRAYALDAVELALVALALDNPAVARWAAEFGNEQALRFLRVTFGDSRNAVTIVVGKR